MRYNNISILFCFLMTFMLFSCGDKEVKKVSDDSKIAQEAFRLIETLKKACIENDRATLQENSAEDAFRELFGAQKTFHSADLTFTPTWVEIENSTVSVTVSWKGIWNVKERVAEERGLAIFVLDGRPLKLIRIKRENPFRYP